MDLRNFLLLFFFYYFFLDFSIFLDFSWIVYGLFLKLLRLLQKVTKVNTGHQKWLKPFAGARSRPAYGPYLIVIMMMISSITSLSVYILSRECSAKCTPLLEGNIKGFQYSIANIDILYSSCIWVISPRAEYDS